MGHGCPKAFRIHCKYVNAKTLICLRVSVHVDEDVSSRSIIIHIARKATERDRRQVNERSRGLRRKRFITTIFYRKNLLTSEPV